MLQTQRRYDTVLFHDHRWVRRLPVRRLGVACHAGERGWEPFVAESSRKVEFEADHSFEINAF